MIISITYIIPKESKRTTEAAENNRMLQLQINNRLGIMLSHSVRPRKKPAKKVTRMRCKMYL